MCVSYLYIVSDKVNGKERRVVTAIHLNVQAMPLQNVTSLLRSILHFTSTGSFTAKMKSTIGESPA